MKHIHQSPIQVCSSLIGTPYEKEDCWGIVRQFYKKVYDIDIPKVYSEIPEVGRRDTVITYYKSNFIKVDNPEIGDIILLNVLGIPAHVGIWIDETQFLHSVKDKNCTVERIFTYRHKIEGYYRWQPSS